MGFMHSLELDNFKSFKGKHLIGPLKKFTAIIGPNGAGKSNLMDAISFVLGEKSTALRVRKLTDLIHGASIDKPVSNQCQVTLNYEETDGSRRVFSRAVKNNMSEYFVDGRAVSSHQYIQALQEINVFIKAHNFLAYQGTVEQIAMQSPQDLTKMFEELSRSKQFQAEYQRLQEEVSKAENEAMDNMSKRRDVAQEKRMAKAEKEMANKFQQAKEDLSKKSTKYYMAQLYTADLAEKRARQDKKRFIDEASRAQEAKLAHDQEVEEKQKAVKNKRSEIRSGEKELRKQEEEVDKKRPELMKLIQQQEHIKKRVEVLKKCYNAAKKKAEQQEHNVKDAEKKLSVAKKEKDQLVRELQAESQDKRLNLSDDQVKEYRQLKAVADKKTVKISAELYNLQQRLESIKSTIRFETQRLEAATHNYNKLKQELEQDKRQIQSLEEANERNKNQLERERDTCKENEQEIRQVKHRRVELQEELTEVQKQMADLDGDSKESHREQRRNEALDNMKRIYGERVFGRIVEFCTYTNKKYQVAITKILNKHMNSIVVDTDETARACIAYLNEQRHEPETFLPLNVLEVQPIKESLRNLHSAKLVMDVIQCSFPNAKKALQFACGNSLVADSNEVAKQLAYGSDRHKTVSLDGTLYTPDGIISGGASDLKQKSRKWDEKESRRLKEKRRKVEAELQQLQQHAKRELDLENRIRNCNNLDRRIHFTEIDIRQKSNALDDYEVKMAKFESEMNNSRDRIELSQQEQEQIQEEIEKAQAKRDLEERDLFADFCTRIGVKSIREYEERELHFHEELNKRVSEFDAQIQKLENELEFLKEEKREETVEREKQKITELELEITDKEKSIKRQTKELDSLEKRLGTLKESLESLKQELEEAEHEYQAAKKEGHDIEKQASAAEKKIMSQEQVISRKREQRHALLLECKVHNVELPLLQGSLDSLVPEEGSEDPQSSMSQATTVDLLQLSQQSDSIEIDFHGFKNQKRIFDDESEATRQVAVLQKAMNEAQERLAQIAPPITDVEQRMREVQAKERQTTGECEQARQSALKTIQSFDRVKHQRLDRFQQFFEPVAQNIDEIYKRLTKTQSAQAYLGPINMEEPYLDGIQYNCIAPGKRFRPMDNLSGGEKTIAALALLFAIHASNPSPFFVLDEVDAALDNTNIGLVVNYIKERSREDLQVIVISLKEEMYSKADALIGVFPKKTHPCIASAILTLDLENF